MKKLLLSLALLPLSFTLAVAAPININKADRTEIVENLTGIGNVKADAIIEYREANGPFEKVEDLLKVKGIGAKTVEQIKDDLIKDPNDDQKLAK